MHGPDTFSELDLALVNALQLRPRAAWSELAPPLGVTPSTLARRWQRLNADGLAWVSATPGRAFSRSRCTAFVMIRCRPGARARVIDVLTRCPEIATIEVASGGCDLLLDVLAPDLRTIGDLLTGQLDRLPGITSLSCVFATSLYVEGSHWRLRSLDPAQLTALHTTPAAVRDPTRALGLDPIDHALLDELVRNGRLSWAELAQRIGTSTATARRRVNRLLSADVLTFRCDIAASLAGRPVPVSLLGQVPAEDLDTVHRTFAALPECRVAAATTGDTNVFATLWVHDLGDVQRREKALCSRLPTLTVNRRIVGLRTVKLMGHLLDDDGRRTGVQPIAPW